MSYFDDDFYEDEDEKPELDRVDRALDAYISNATTITDPDVIAELKRRYGADSSKTYELHRGLNFTSDKSLDRFKDSVQTGTYQDHYATSWSPDESTASEFAKTPKTYNDMSLARISMEGLRNGEHVVGAGGVLLTASISGEHLIDPRKAKVTKSEVEMILLPTTAVEVRVKEIVPFKKVVDSAPSLNALVLETDDSKLRSYIMQNHGEELSDEAITPFVDMAKKDWERERSDALNYVSAKKTYTLGESFDGVGYKVKEFKQRNRVSHHILMDTGNYLSVVSEENYRRTKSGPDVTVAADVPAQWILLYERGLLSPEQAMDLREAVDAIGEDLRRVCEQFDVTTFDRYTMETMKMLASPEIVEAIYDTISMRKGAELQDLCNSAYGTIMSKDDIDAFSQSFEQKLNTVVESIFMKQTQGATEQTLKSGRAVTKPNPLKGR